MDVRAPAVVAVVVTTGPGPGLEATLASLVDQDYGELSVLVVANGESEHVAARVAAVAPDAFVRVLAENRGFAAACNEAVLAVEGATFFLFCHDDVRLDPDAVHRLVEAAFRMNAGVLTPKVVAYDDPMTLLHVGQTCDRFGVVQERVEPGEIDHGQQDLERDVFVAPGGVTLIRADLFVTLQGFDPLIPMLGEDLDFCWRAQLAGARIVVAPGARVAHRQTVASGERPVTAIGTRKASRQDLQRRHRLLVVATGWGRWTAVNTLAMLLVLDLVELVVAIGGRDGDRVGAILGSWRWLVHNRRRVRERRRQRRVYTVLTDDELRRLQVGGATRLRKFIATLLRDGLDRARGILPPDSPVEEAEVDAGVGFAAAFAEVDAFDEIPQRSDLAVRRPSRFLTSFRAQALTLVLVSVLWLIGSRNLVATHLPLVGRLAPLDSWWSTWRHFFASWSPNGLGTGTPGMPGYGVLAVAGTFVLGRMGILPRVALIFAIPIGAFGVGRLLRGRVSNRARLVAVLAYVAAPIGLNMISQGRIDVLVVSAGLPFVVRRLMELLAVPGFRDTPYPPAVPFGNRGWPATRSGQRMVVVMETAIVSAMAPAMIIAVVLVVLGVVVARWFEPDGAPSRPWRLLGAVLGGVAVFLAPMTVDVVLAGRRAIELFGLARGPWSAPSLTLLARGADGGFGASWWGWLLPGAAVIGLLLTRGDRRVIAGKFATIATLSLVLAALTARHWLGDFAPDLDVLLTLYAVSIAGLIGLGVAALESDLRQAGFGWRQSVAAIFVAVIAVSALPFLGDFASGRFNLPVTSVAESMSAAQPPNAGGYRILWLGDPSVLPMPGWSVAPGLAAATSMNGLPGGSTLFSPPDSGTSDVLLEAINLALLGRTVHVGSLLAQAGVATVVVMDSPAPEYAGAQGVPTRPVPKALMATLARQTDLALQLQSPAVTIYANAAFHGLVAQSSRRSSTGWSPLAGPTFGTGTVSPGATVVAGLAPASAFALSVNGVAATRRTVFGWAPAYLVNNYRPPVTAQLVLRQFPLNGLLALFTLGLWAIVWLGFGSVQRFERIASRRGRVKRAAHGDRT